MTSADARWRPTRAPCGVALSKRFEATRVHLRKLGTKQEYLVGAVRSSSGAGNVAHPTAGHRFIVIEVIATRCSSDTRQASKRLRTMDGNAACEACWYAQRSKDRAVITKTNFEITLMSK